MNRYNHLPQLTQESDTNARKHLVQVSQKFSIFPVGDHKATMNRPDSMTDTKHKLQKRTPLETADIKIIDASSSKYKLKFKKEIVQK